MVGATALVRGWSEPRWVLVHLFLAGAVVLAISGVSLMLTVTWAAAPAPPDGWVGLQQACVAVGAIGVVLGRSTGAAAAVVGAAGALYVAGLLGLAALLVVTARRGVERRFDAAVAWYVAAVVAGVVGVALGVAAAVEGPGSDLRQAHLASNLLGLVGLVIAGTLPYFAATVGRSRMWPGATPRALVAVLAWQVVALALVVSAFVAGARAAAVVGLVAYAAGLVATMARMPRPNRRQLRWSGPRSVGLWAGAAWWVVAVLATAVDVAAGRVAFAGRWLEVLVVAGYAQVLWASLAHLLPVLRGGGHERLGEGFAATRSWVGLAAANLAGVALVGGWRPLAVAAVAGWVLDGTWRAARVGTAAASRPGSRPDAAAGSG